MDSILNYYVNFPCVVYGLVGYNAIVIAVCFQGKPGESRGRKVTGLRDFDPTIAGLPDLALHSEC
jgi:hypothetical protein